MSVLFPWPSPHFAFHPRRTFTNHHTGWRCKQKSPLQGLSHALTFRKPTEHPPLNKTTIASASFENNKPGCLRILFPHAPRGALSWKEWLKRRAAAATWPITLSRGGGLCEWRREMPRLICRRRCIFFLMRLPRGYVDVAVVKRKGLEICK